jgi:L-fuculose-phosphate aldolase
MKTIQESKKMINDESTIRGQIVEVCQRLYARNMLAAGDGNVSYRLSDQRILFTPSGRPKAFIHPEQITVVTLNGEILQGKPSGERDMHLEIYRRCPQAKAVIHAHPPHAVAWSLARPQLKELPAEHLSEVILGAGRIPFVPYARPTTADMGEVLRPYLPDCRALILTRHGGVCWGESLEEALNGMERLEHSAQILWLAETLGGSKPLPREEVDVLRAMRVQMGDKLL